MNNILILVTMSSISLTKQLQLMTFCSKLLYITNMCIVFFFTDHLDLLVNISRTSLLMMLPLKTKADRLIPNQVAH